MKFIIFGLQLCIFVLGFTNIATANFQRDGFSQIAKKAFPSVVNIGALCLANDSEAIQKRLETMLKKSPKKDLFGSALLNQPRKFEAQGSGFIIDAAGFIVTNYHVVEDAIMIKVVLSDDTVLDAKLVGKDRKTDLALLKVNTTKKLTPLKWGNSEKCKIGEWAILLGNPYGIGLSLSTGTISTELRDATDISELEYIENLVQTDAPMNPGNSGGPMLNIDGQVIGVNAMIATKTGGGHGVGLAIPSNIAQRIIQNLKKHGKVPRSWLGVSCQPITLEIADNLGITANTGLLIANIAKKGPAEKAGLQPGDVVLKFNGHEVDSMKRLLSLIEKAEIHQPVTLDIYRPTEQGFGKHFKVSTKIEEQNDYEETKGLEIFEGVNLKDRIFNKLYGLGYMTLMDQNRHQFNIVDPDVKGVLIYEVKEGGVAEQATLQIGDVIMKINGKSLGTINDLTSILEEKSAKNDSKPILAYIYRDNVRFFLPLPSIIRAKDLN